MADTVHANFGQIGGLLYKPTDHTGPAAYTTGGEVLGTPNALNGITSVGLGSIDFIHGSGSLSISGNFYIRFKPNGTGSRKTWNLLWYPVGTDTQVAAGTNLTGETVEIVYVGR